MCVPIELFRILIHFLKCLLERSFTGNNHILGMLPVLNCSLWGPVSVDNEENKTFLSPPQHVKLM